MCCTRLAGNTGRKNYAKNRHLRTIAQLCRAIYSQLRHVSTIGNKFVKQQYFPHMSLQYGELRPTIGWDRFVSLGHPSKFQVFAHSQPSHIGCIPYFRIRCGLSANLGCRSETCCMRLAESTERQKSPNIRHLRTIAQRCLAISSQRKHVSQIYKKTC